MIERMGQPYGDCDEGDEFSQLYGMTYSRRVSTVKPRKLEHLFFRNTC